MTKKKPRSGGEHKTPRVTVQLPAEWHALARKLASRQRQHVTWYLISLIIDAAKASGEEDILPTPPWEPEADSN
jgi:hypothetical protein